MPITLTNVMNSGAQLGPGSQFAIQVAGGVNAGDLLIVYVSHTPVSGAGDQVLTGQMDFSTAHGSGSTLTCNGYFCVETDFDTFAVKSIFPGGQWPADGDSVYVHALILRGISTLATQDTIGFSYHHAAGLGNLAWALHQLVGSSVDVADIKNAVIRTFPGHM